MPDYKVFCIMFTSIGVDGIVECMQRLGEYSGNKWEPMGGSDIW